MKRLLASVFAGLILIGGLVLADDYDVAFINIASMATNPLSTTVTNDTVIKGDLLGVSVEYKKNAGSTNSVLLTTVANVMGPSVTLLSLTNMTADGTYYPFVERCTVTGVLASNCAAFPIPGQNIRLRAHSGAGDSANASRTNDVKIFLFYNRK